MKASRLMVTLIAALVGAGGAVACAGWRIDPLRASAVDGDTAQERRGQQLFAVHCHQCHPWGTAGLGPALNNKPLPGIAIAAQVRRGLGEMPAFSEAELSDAELDALVAYVEALRRR